MDNAKQMPVYCVATMQEAERRTESDYGISVSELMDNAGKGLSREVRRMIGSSSGSVAIFCGTGNNGGDGYVCARELLQHGMDVTVYATGSPHPGGIACQAADSYRAVGGAIRTVGGDDADDLVLTIGGSELLVDCLLGTGLSRPVSGAYSSLIILINQTPVPVLSCDIPSGINADDGAVMGLAVQADRTLVMGLAKPACVIPPGCDYLGDITICDIGLPPELVATLKPVAT